MGEPILPRALFNALLLFAVALVLGQPKAAGKNFAL